MGEYTDSVQSVENAIRFQCMQQSLCTGMFIVRLLIDYFTVSRKYLNSECTEPRPWNYIDV
jgi:hypothetical protein